MIIGLLGFRHFFFVNRTGVIVAVENYLPDKFEEILLRLAS